MIVACCGGVVCLYILFWDIRKPMWCTCVPRLAECVAHFVFACSRRGKCAVTLFFANLHTISSRLSLAQFVSFCHNRPASSHPNRMHFNVLFSGMKVVLSLAKTKIWREAMSGSRRRVDGGMKKLFIEEMANVRNSMAIRIVWLSDFLPSTPCISQPYTSHSNSTQRLRNLPAMQNLPRHAREMCKSRVSSCGNCFVPPSRPRTNQLPALRFVQGLQLIIGHFYDHISAAGVA